MADDSPTLDDVLRSPDLRSIKEILLAQLAQPEFPITGWNVGGVARTLYELEAIVLEDLVSHGIPIVAAGGAPDTAEKDWLTILAHGWFAIDRTPAVLAQQTVTLACDSSHGPYVLSAGRQYLQASDGSQYALNGSGTLSPSSTLVIDAIAETPASARGLINAVSTRNPLAGVTVMAAAIKIISGVPQYGADQQSDTSLLKAIGARWPALGGVPDKDRIVKWCLASDPTITRARLDPDTGIAGGAMATVASAGGGVSGAVVTAAQTYVDARLPITDYVTVFSASTRTIVANGLARVPAAKMADAKAAADAAWIAYNALVEIGGEVSIEKLIQVVMDAGADNFINWTINGAGADLPLAPHEVPVPADTLTNELTWVGT